MRNYVVQLQIGTKTREYIRPAYSPHKLRRDIERNYPDVQVVEIYKL